MLQFRPVAAQVEVSAQLDSTRIMIGDQVRLHLSITHDRNAQVQNIDLSVLEKEPRIELISAPPPDTVPGSQQVILQQELTLTSFDSGYYLIPAIPVHFVRDGQPDVAYTRELPLEVTTFPISSDSVSLAPIKNIIEEPFKAQDLLPYGIAAAALAMAGFLIWYLVRGRHRVRSMPPPAPPRPPHEVALEKLAALREADLVRQGAIKAYHSQLTYIVREYLENRFAIRALESTTDEILTQLGRQATVAGWSGELRRMLQTADLVKFAKAEPPATIHQELMTTAERFVDTTKEEPKSEEGSEALEKPEENA